MLSFCEEEGSRFNGARFWGSRGVTGAIAPGDAEAIGSYDGVSLAEAMQSVGLDPADIPSAVRHDIEAFIELHIEQGPVLEIEDLPVGVVNIINGSKGYNVTVTGEAVALPVLLPGSGSAVVLVTVAMLVMLPVAV